MKKKYTSKKKSKPTKKRKYKGVRYIAKALHKYYPKRYPTYTSALPRARTVFDEISAKGEKVKLSTIFDVVRTKRTGYKTNVPEIDDNLTSPSYYFELQDYPIYIARTIKDVFFLSKISPEGLPDIQGGELVDYQEYFSSYVNYINKMQNESTRSSGLYSSEWMVKCTPPYWNTAKKRFESKIISCDSEGNEFDYGFNPEETEQTPKSVVVSSSNKQNASIAPETSKTSLETIKPTSNEVSAELEKVKLEQKRQENIKEAMDLLKSGAISKKDFADLLKLIKG